jgi:ribonuclease HII
MSNLYVAGVDEVGRGPLAGDVVTAAVILNPQHPIVGLNDSKKLSELKRTVLANEIKNHAVAWAIGRASAQEVDELNILEATMLAMQRAVSSLAIKPEKVFVDGNKCPKLDVPVEAIVQGDGLIDCISAASILAKVQRDSEMVELHRLYPSYGFKQHKGYPTKLHLQKIQEHGITPYHRTTFGPVRRYLEALEHD